MPSLPRPTMPESLLWLSNELYWRQNLSTVPRAAEPQPEAPRRLGLGQEGLRRP